MDLIEKCERIFPTQHRISDETGFTLPRVRGGCKALADDWDWRESGEISPRILAGGLDSAGRALLYCFSPLQEEAFEFVEN
jgi:hypothetical protein